MRDFFADIDWARWLEEAWTTGARVLVILLVLYVALRLVKRFLEPTLRNAVTAQMEGQPQIEIDKRVETLSSVVYRTAQVLAVVIALLTVLPEFGINTGALIAGAGIVGLAVGFGAQTLVKDVIGGTFVIVENQFGKGDIVDLNGIVGEVVDVNLRRTVLRDLDGTVHSIPHSVPQTTSNLTRSFSRINMNVGVSYSEDLDHVYEVIRRTGRELTQDPEWKDKVISPPEVLGLDVFGESSLEIRIVGDTAPMQQWAVAREFRKRLKEAFDREGIEIPYPHRTLVSIGSKANKEGLVVRQATNGKEPPGVSQAPPLS
jgi:small conductance mechanosensitive channel